MAAVAITGAAGFIGGRLCAAFAAAGRQVIGLGRQLAATGPAATGTAAGMTKAALDPDPQILAAILNGVDLVIHAAASSPAPGRRIETFVADNVMTTATLLQAMALAGVPRLVFLSAVSVYGEPDVSVLEETTPPTNPDAYGLSKRLAEMLCRQAAAEGTIDRILALRLPGVVGPGMRRPWLGQMARYMLASQDVMLHHPEALFNNALHVNCLCDFVIAAADRLQPGYDCVNLAAGRPMTVMATATEMRRRLGSASSIRVVPADRAACALSTRRAEERYGFTPQAMTDLLDRLVHDVASPQP